MSIQALTGSKIDSITGVIKRPCELTYQQIVDSGVVKVGNFFPNARFQDVVKNALSGKCIYFDEISNVEVKWISAKIETTPVHIILKAFKMISEQTSNVG